MARAFRQVVVTGIGPLLANCASAETLWAHLREARSQLAFEPDPAQPDQQVCVGRVQRSQLAPHLRAIPKRFLGQYEPEVQLYLASLHAALEHAALDLSKLDREKVGLFDGCSRPMFDAWVRRLTQAPAYSYSRRDLATATPGQAAGLAASLLEVYGSVYTFNGTCSSGAIAIGHALREVELGLVDIALATGHESSLHAPMFAMYREGGLLSSEHEDPTRAVRPFGDCLGNAFGEGAVTLVLESRESAEARGANILAVASGYAYGNTGYHPTSPDIAGGLPARLVRRLVTGAGLSLDDIGFVVGHGNAVELSDSSEENYMLLLFDERAKQVPLLSNKPIFGHTLGASSALNAAQAVLMLQHQYVAPTLNGGARGTVEHMSGKGEARSLEAGLAVSFGLGGNTAALLFERAEGK
jgi:3-oxoacyl-[acyl-carrier-protein] synthase II